jgi:hypothetical protein
MINGLTVNIVLVSQKLPTVNPEGFALSKVDHISLLPQNTLTALIAFFGEDPSAPKSITIAIHATPTYWQNAHRYFRSVEAGGSVHSGVHNMYLALKPSLEAYHALFERLPKGFPITFIGQGVGGAIASFAAVDFKEKFGLPNATLLTINTAAKWDFTYAQRMDRVVKNVHRWRDGYIHYHDMEGDPEEMHEIWHVNNQVMCCPKPESTNCKKLRGVLYDGMMGFGRIR